MAPDRNAASRNAASIAGVRGVCAVRPGSGAASLGGVRRGGGISGERSVRECGANEFPTPRQ